jgi:hypothetical protein
MPTGIVYAVWSGLAIVLITAGYCLGLGQADTGSSGAHRNGPDNGGRDRDQCVFEVGGGRGTVGRLARAGVLGGKITIDQVPITILSFGRTVLGAGFGLIRVIVGQADDHAVGVEHGRRDIARLCLLRSIGTISAPEDSHERA